MSIRDLNKTPNTKLKVNLNKNQAWYTSINWIYIIIGIYIFIYILHLLLKFHFVLWDEAVYIGIGKYLYSFGHVGLWESIRPLGLPLLLGLPWKLGLDAVISARLIEMLFSAGTIILVYMVSRKIFAGSKHEKFIALSSAFIYAITPLFVYNSFRVMSEIPSTFFVLLAVYFFVDRKLVLAGTATSLAFLFKYPQGLILVCILLAIFMWFVIEVKLSRQEWKQKLRDCIKNISLYIMGFLPVIIALLIFNYYKYSSILYPFQLASLHQNNLVHAQGSLLTSLAYYPFTLFIQNHLLAFAVVGLGLGAFIFVNLFSSRKQRIDKNHMQNQMNLAFIALILLIYLIYYTQMINKQDRFALSFLPFAAILCAYGWVYVYEKITCSSINCLHKRWRSLLILVLVLFTAYSITLSLHKDYYKFNSFPDEQPAIVDEYYKFFPDGYQGTILTADPVHAAYSDVKMMPYYYSVGEGLEEYDAWINNPEVKAVVFIPGAFICFDKACEEKRAILFDEIKNNKNLNVVFDKEFEEEKTIYLKK